MEQSSIQQIPPQLQRIIQRLFVFVDSKNIQLNQQLNLVVNPQIMKILFAQAINQNPSIKILIIRKISAFFQKNQLNSMILSKRDRQILQFNYSILDQLISFAMGIKTKIENTQYVVSLIQPFLKNYTITCRNIRNITKILAKSFYQEKFQSVKLILAVKILNIMIKSQIPQLRVPESNFLFYGQNSGIRLINENLKWSLGKGFYLYTWICFPEKKPKTPMNILDIFVQNSQFSLFVDEDNFLKIKVFEVARKFSLKKLQSNKWHFITVKYYLKTGIIRNTFDMIVYLQGQPYELKDLPIPQISIKSQIDQLILGQNFYGLINSAIISREQIIQAPQFGIGNWGDFEKFLLLNKKALKNIFLIYTPLVSTNFNQKQIVFDVSTRNHAQILQNTGINVNPFKSVQIGYYGGLYNFLPLFYILKFYSYESCPTALQQMLNLTVNLFQSKIKGIQDQAISCQFFNTLGLFFSLINFDFITIECMNIIGKLKNLVKDENLRKDFFVNFLWKIKVKSIKDPQICEKLFLLINEQYMYNLEWSLQIFSVQSILRYIIQNFQPQSSNQCCIKHYLQIKSSEKMQENYENYEQIIQIQQLYKNKGAYVKKLLITIFQGLGPNPNKKLPKQRENRLYLLHQKFNILKFLLPKYSICFRTLLLDSLYQTMQQNSLIFVRQLNILPFLYSLLTEASLRDQILLLIKIFSECIDEVDTILQNQIIGQIHDQMQKLYLRKYTTIKVRSKSQKIGNRKSELRRKYSEEMEQTSFSKKEKLIKEKLLIYRKQTEKLKDIQNDNVLFQYMIKICFCNIEGHQEIILKQDIFILVVQPYFKLCCPKFKVKLIQMMRNTILITGQPFEKYLRLYKFMISQFVQRQLEPNDPQYAPSTQINFVQKNMNFIIDHVVMALKNNWNSLYHYIVISKAFLQDAIKELQQKTIHSQQDIYKASKICVRKFVLRIVKHAEQQIQNFPNLIFLVYVVTVNNMKQDIEESEKDKNVIFDYFKRLEPYLLLDKFDLLDSGNHTDTKNITFVDYKLILQSLLILKLQNFELRGNIQNSNNSTIISSTISQGNEQTSPQNFQNLNRKSINSKIMNRIRAYLESQYETTSKLRKIFLSCASFQQQEQQQKKQGFKKIISSFLSYEQINQNGYPNNICVAQIISLLLGLCIQSSLHCKQIQLLKQSLKHIQQFFKVFILVCSKDGLKRQSGNQRNKTLPKNICYHIIHFLYAMMQNQLPMTYNQQIQNTLKRMFDFLGMLITVLNQKLGNPSTIDYAIMLSEIKKEVQQFNYFSFEILSNVMSIVDIKQFPNISYQKAIEILQHKNLKNHFKKTPQSRIQRQIRQASQTHRKNVQKLKNQMKTQMSRNDDAELIRKFSINLYCKEQLEEKQLEHLKQSNLHYRYTMRIWRKVWKRIRIFHYFWAVAMDQTEKMQFNQPWKKKKMPYKHKFSKFMDKVGLRSILQVQPNQTWNVMKMRLEEQIKYRNSNFLFNLYKNNKHLMNKPKTFLQKMFSRVQQSQQFYVTWIKHNSKRKGSVRIGQQKLIFIYDSTFQKDSHMDFTSFTLAQYKPIKKQWDLVLITNILKRRYLVPQDCLLIQFQDLTSVIFVFQDQDAEQFIKLINQKQESKIDKKNFLKLNNVKFYTEKFTGSFSLEIKMQQWRKNKISTLQYLMYLNKYSGRSYLDPVHYPVIPWIISNYQVKQFSYRDLNKTLGALGSESRRQYFLSKSQNIDPFNPVPLYQYGTHYSSPGVVFNFLIRINPYSEAARTLQGGKFDLSDRLFHSLKWCWHSVTNQVSDVRQLTPQFFYLPQILINIQNYDFGVTQQNERVHNVKLPIWAKDPFEFITIHRRCLQSENVNKYISNWIDLIFGYKQKGKIAQDNLNLYYYLTYQNSVDIDSIQDPIQKTSVEAQMIHFGQTPCQLFTKSHPSKYTFTSVQKFPYKKVCMVGCFQSFFPLQILYHENNSLYIYRQSSIYRIQYQNTFKWQQKINLLRNSSKQNLFHVQDIASDKRVIVFKQNRFIVISSYVNGDIVIYNLLTGAKVQQKKGSVKTCIYINQSQNLLICGCKDGLLEIYEIVYGQKQNLTLLRIASQYYIYPIQNISQSSGFFVISAGNLAIINKINRGMAYVYQKTKLKGCKMIRSFESKRKILGSFIINNPLTCLVFYNALQLYVYSINGQLLTVKQLQIKLAPLVIKDQSLFEYIVAVQEKSLLILKTPQLQVCKNIPIPSKQYSDMKVYDKKIFLVTNEGEFLLIKQQGI